MAWQYGSDCREACCSTTGLSVAFSVSDLYKCHLHLYKTALAPVVAHYIVQDERQRGNLIAWDTAESLYIGRFCVEKGKPNIPGIIQYLLGKGDFCLPYCAVRELPPEGMRVYLDHQHEAQRFHGILPRTDGAIFSRIMASVEVAMALGPAWTNCPYFVQAKDLENFALPRPSNAVVAAMVSPLQKLLDMRLITWAVQGAHGEELLELSGYIVTLCEEPQTLFDLDAPPTHITVPPMLGDLLLAALKKGYVDTIKPTSEWVVSAIANSLGLDVGEVYADHPCVESLPSEDDAHPRSMVLFGTVVPCHIDYGQLVTPELQEMEESAAQQYAVANLASPGCCRPRAAEPAKWDRLERLKDGHVVVDLAQNGSLNLALPAMLRHRLFREGELPEARVEVALSDLSGVLAAQTDDSALGFTREACTDTLSLRELQKLVESATDRPAQPRRSNGQRWQQAAEAFGAQGRAVAVATAASVVAVINSDPKSAGLFQRVAAELTNDLVADFVVAYLSCRLRVAMAKAGAAADEYRLPLATRAVMTLPLSGDDLDDDLTAHVPGHIQPPLPHQAVYLATIDLARSTIGTVMGVSMAQTLKEGIGITRAAMGLHSSFIVWFLDTKRFDVALAIQHDNSPVSAQEAETWAGRLVAAAAEHLEGAVADPPNGLVARDRHTKLVLLITWSETMHKKSLWQVCHMLKAMEVAPDYRLASNIKVTRLDTDEPRVERLDEFGWGDRQPASPLYGERLVGKI